MKFENVILIRSALAIVLLIFVLLSMTVMRRFDKSAGQEGGNRLW